MTDGATSRQKTRRRSRLMPAALSSTPDDGVGASSSAAEINVTPLVDVVLVLLLIFMVIAPSLERSPKLTLPSAANTEIGPTDEQRVIVGVENDGSFFVDGRPVTASGLEERLRSAAATPEVHIYIQGDKTVPYARIRRALEHIRAAGATRVSLATSRLDSETGDGLAKGTD
ncbi:MAG: biopolymer transporter ExbD [Deltaproteobacteria bacterium]|nr:biopolymer transporter ExbD [Deltaproteobacteria bacterium]